MRNLHMSAKALVIGLAALFVGANVAQAQEMMDDGDRMDHRWVGIQAHGGIAIPVSDLSDVADPGLSLGMDFDYYVTPRFIVGASGQLDNLSGKELGADVLPPGAGATDGPGMRLWHFHGRLGYDLAPPEGSFHAILNAGGGATLMDTDRFTDPDLGGSGTALLGISEWYPSLGGGIELSGSLNPDWHIFVSGRAQVAFMDEDDLDRLAELYPEAESISTGFTFPITAGVRVTMPSLR